MKYSKHYSKLDEQEYTTIRRYRKGRTGDIKPETLNDKVLHHAVITCVIMRALSELPTEFLLKDTDAKSRKDAYDLIQSFYRKPINFEKEKFYVYYMKKVKV